MSSSVTNDSFARFAYNEAVAEAIFSRLATYASAMSGLHHRLAGLIARSSSS